MSLNQLEAALYSKKNYSAFTLIELLIVMGILGLLMAVTILVINPAQYLKQARDTNRVTDMETLHKAISLYMASSSGSGLGVTGDVYVSLPSTLSDCSDLGLPAGPTYHCVTQANLTKTDGTGWVPVNLSTGGFSSPLPKLPIDPTNTVSGGKYYTYVPNYQLTAALESTKYTAQYPTNLVAQGLTTNTPLIMLERGSTTTIPVGPVSVTMNPGTVTDDAAIGLTAWTTPNNAKVSDDIYTTYYGDHGYSSHYLIVSNFGFTIPTGATINGIVAQVELHGDGTNVTYLHDYAVRIVKGGAIGATDNSSTGINYPSTDAYWTYGANNNLWGETWTAEQINASNFGLAYATVNGSGFSHTVYVDHIRITVYYTNP